MAEKKRKIDMLNAKHKDFLLNYLRLGRNGRKAYIATYPKTKTNSAYEMASRLLRNVKIKEALIEYQEILWKDKEEKIGMLFDKLLDVVGADIGDFIDENGDIKVDEFNQLNTFVLDQYSKSVSETQQGVNVRYNIKLKDALKAISELTKILGMIQEKITVDVNVDKESINAIQEIFNEQISDKKDS